MSLDVSVARLADIARSPVLPRATTRSICAKSGVAANDAPDRAMRDEGNRPGDPMLLVFEERVHTFRLLAQIVRRGMALLRPRG